ncbi:MAG: hypothetical protein MR778_08120 [Clostridiales bacterium]|nr:hypothetical protein [Clostridiales bacterium]MDD6936417.1 hypothetical protein [Clostridiales bacterium]MDY2961306.1 hypothetical protein [Oscillospiraceae bacterium]
MSETGTGLQARPAADHRLFLKLYHRYLHETAEPVYETVAEPEADRKLTLFLALAPMVIAFLYLMLVSCFLFF